MLCQPIIDGALYLPHNPKYASLPSQHPTQSSTVDLDSGLQQNFPFCQLISVPYDTYEGTYEDYRDGRIPR